MASSTATASPTRRTLVLWEAQFGDFANGAQVIIDQFLSSGEAKWLRMSGLVLLLPHGYEGQGPEHSSARLERYLQLCAEDNMQVCNLTTRRQLFPRLAPPDRAAISASRSSSMTPKSLLRAKEVDLARWPRWGRAAHSTGSSARPRRSPMTTRSAASSLRSGKVYFDLAKARAESGDDRVALVRVEQLYPFPFNALAKVLQRYRNAEIVWCQEEPQNMGAWNFVDRRIEQVLGRTRHRGKAAALRRPRRGRFARHRPLQARTSTSRPSSSRALALARALMATEIKVPSLGESVTEATVAKWLKQPGDVVALDDPLVELETDKATLEIPAPAAGILGAILAAEGADVPVGAVLGTIADGQPL